MLFLIKPHIRLANLLIHQHFIKPCHTWVFNNIHHPNGFKKSQWTRIQKNNIGIWYSMLSMFFKSLNWWNFWWIVYHHNIFILVTFYFLLKPLTFAQSASNWSTNWSSANNQDICVIITFFGCWMWWKQSFWDSIRKMIPLLSNKTWIYLLHLIN